MVRRMQAHILLVSLVGVWLVVLFFHERYVPYAAAARCEWPVPVDAQPDENLTKLMLVADPQLIDNHTYPGRHPILMAISQLFVDRYLRQNYHALINELQPDFIIFLGDYLDNGRSATDAYFYTQLARFKSIFFRDDYPVGKRMFVQVPGNHDFGWADGVKVASKQRFTKEFGPPNSVVTINGVDFIMVDAPSLGASHSSAIREEALSFIDSLSHTHPRPRVLLSHIPLYRDPNTKKCGPLREGSPFRLQAGYQYQTVLDSEVSRWLIDSVKPDLVFSGDDHDYCDITHFEGGPREVTVKSISMAMGISRPAVQLLTYKGASAGSSTDILNCETRPCYCSVPYADVRSYSVLGAVTVIAILLMAIRRGLMCVSCFCRGCSGCRSRRLCSLC